MKRRRPRYPVYIPSKGRSEILHAAKMFDRDGVPFRVVVEPQEVDAYAAVVGKKRVLVLPENNRGLVYSRNWIKDHARGEGHERHWQFDDDVRRMIRLHGGRRLPCESNVALAAAEDFVERYENVALASFNSWFFTAATGGIAQTQWPPFYLNSRCYTCFLMLNSIPNRWRGRYNEDTDMTLQVLADGWCTMLFNVFLIDTPETMTSGGGQTSIYVDDGRLKMARELERRWPGIVDTRRRFNRPQHHVAFHWMKFDTPLVKRKGARVPKENPYRLKLREVKPVKNKRLKRFAKEHGA